MLPVELLAFGVNAGCNWLCWRVVRRSIWSFVASWMGCSANCLHRSTIENIYVRKSNYSRQREISKMGNREINRGASIGRREALRADLGLQIIKKVVF